MSGFRPTPPPMGTGGPEWTSGPSTDPANAPKNVGFLEAISRAFRQFAKFSGRASGSEYWWFMFLFIPASILTFGLGLIVLSVPALAITSRRIQDTGRSSSFYFRMLVGILVLCPVCFILFFVTAFAGSEIGLHIALALPLVALSCTFVYGLALTALPSTPGANEYGPGPE